MALGGVSIGWEESVPSSSSNAGLGEQDIRSIKTSVRNALDSEHVFPSTGGVAGAHRPGSAVAFYGASSAISSTDTNGRIMVDSTNSRLHHVGSADTRFLGGQYVPEAGPLLKLLGSNTTSTTTQVWCVEAGVGLMKTSSSTTAVTLQNTYVNGVVTITQSKTSAGVSLGGPLADHPLLLAASIGAGGSSFIVMNHNASDAQASATTCYDFTWQVVGIKAL